MLAQRWEARSPFRTCLLRCRGTRAAVASVHYRTEWSRKRTARGQDCSDAGAPSGVEVVGRILPVGAALHNERGGREQGNNAKSQDGRNCKAGLHSHGCNCFILVCAQRELPAVCLPPVNLAETRITPLNDRQSELVRRKKQAKC